MKRLIMIAFMLTAARLGFSQQQSINMETELKRLYSIPSLPAYSENSQIGMESSYDRTGRNNDGFEGTYSFIRKNDDGSLVIFEAAGKGVIERIWTPTPTDDTLDFYFDGASSPSYSIMFNDLFSGKVSPFLEPVVGKRVGGWYSYLPIPYNNGIKIVFRGKKMLFHQIQNRSYSGNVQVATFKPQLSDAALSVMKQIQSDWSAKPTPRRHQADKVNVESKNMTLQPGGTVTLAKIQTGGRIVHLGFTPGDVFAGMENAVDLRITWDGEKVPAVYGPAADFFGYAFGSPSMKSLLSGVDDGKAYCYIPMPFDRSATIELVYRKTKGEQPVLKINSEVGWVEQKRKTGEGKFYAYWKREVPALGSPYVFLEGKGKGHYIGTLLLSQAKTYNHHTEFFEGDDSTVLDGKSTLHGTGSEDYFNGGWYAQPNGWVERKGAPLSGCLDYSLPLSRTGGYRFYTLDKLPFQKSIYHSIEHGPEHNNRKVEYTSIAMYYAAAPIATGDAPRNESSVIILPDTFSFYPRLMNYVTYEGDAKLAHGDGEIDQAKTGTYVIDVREVPPGKYKLYVHGRGVHGMKYQLPGQGSESRFSLSEGKNSQQMKDHVLGIIEVNATHDPVRLKVTAGRDKVQLAIFHLAKQ
ncbi:MAG: DUF2961 domain-containing protein [Chitinophagaceae bacterium]|nr:MAG: DUF2961 domain-containing protein [Chitinophagaceae bacterium]